MERENRVVLLLLYSRDRRNVCRRTRERIRSNPYITLRKPIPMIHRVFKAVAVLRSERFLSPPSLPYVEMQW